MNVEVWQEMAPAGLWLVWSAVALAFLHMLALPRKGKKTVLWAGLGGAVGLGLFVVGSDVVFKSLGWVQNSQIVRERFYRPGDIGKAPVYLFVGSSYTRAGINPALANEILKENGLQARIMIRSAGGASRLEQWRFVKETQALLGDQLQGVFFEVSHSIDHLPVYGLKSPMSGRALSQFDVQGTKWVLDALVLADETTQLRGIEEKGEAGRQVLSHLLVSSLNIGLAHHLLDKNDLRNRSSYVPREVAEKDYDPYLQARLLKERAWEQDPSRLPKIRPNPWVRGYFDDVERLLKNSGVELSGFYVPPYGTHTQRRYGFQFCQYQSDVLCVNANKRDLIDRLGPQMWIDSSHLRREGSETFTRWLIERLISQGGLS
ncbi:hypothetical protein [Terasakiella pusilla]|uniref:hypothetical protein n=1 Tax=Terasakiella pusilla TaxID=64973 RepID=UPI003AA9ABFB